MHAEGQDVSAVLLAADDLQGGKVQRAERFGDAFLQSLHTAAPIAFAVVKIHGQQPRLNVHLLSSPLNSVPLRNRRVYQRVLKFIIEET